MRNLKLMLACGLACIVAQGIPTMAIAAAVVAQDGSGVSAQNTTMVKVVRHKKSDNDPLSKYGAGFYIMIFNKSNQPIVIGPENVVVKTQAGQQLNILTDERLAEIREQEAQKSQMFGALFGAAMGAMANSAAAHMNNAVAANNMVALGQMGAMTAAVVSENNAQAILAGTGSLEAAYDAVPFSSTTLPPLSAAGGRLLIEGIKDRDPAQVFITVNGDTHEIDFGKGSR